MESSKRVLEAVKAMADEGGIDLSEYNGLTLREAFEDYLQSEPEAALWWGCWSDEELDAKIEIPDEEEEPPTGEFRITMSIGDDAMLTPDDVAGALGRLVSGFEDLDRWESRMGSIMDCNGNKAGEWVADIG